MRLICAVLMIAALAPAQTYNILTVAPNTAGTAVGSLRFSEASNSSSRHYLILQGPTSLGANVTYRFDGSTTAGACLQLGTTSGGITPITSGPCDSLWLTSGSDIYYPSGSTGNVGIGGVPYERLTVNGNLYVNGSATIDGTKAGGLYLNTQPGTAGHVWSHDSGSGSASLQVGTLANDGASSAAYSLYSQAGTILMWGATSVAIATPDFTVGVEKISDTSPTFTLYETDQGAGNKRWRQYLDASILHYQLGDDAGSSFADWMSIGRSGNTALYSLFKQETIAPSFTVGSSGGAGTAPSAGSNAGTYIGYAGGSNWITSHDGGAGAQLRIGTENSSSTATSYIWLLGSGGILLNSAGGILQSATDVDGLLEPHVNNAYNFGASAKRWATAYVTNLDVSGTCTGCGGGVSFPIVFPSGTASPQLDATGLGAAINFNGSSTSNGNIVLNPGNVAGNASVVVNAARGDQPALYLKSASGTTTAPVFSLRDSSNVARVYVMQSGDASCPNCLNTAAILPTSHALFDLGTVSKQWLTVYGITGHFTEVLLGSTSLTTGPGGVTVTGDLRPDTPGARKLGAVGYEWDEAHVANLTVTGTCTGCGGGGGGVTSLAGTTDQVIVSASTGSITLSTPQSIGTGSSVAFHSINLDAASGSAYQMGGTTVIDASRNANFVNLTVSGACTGCGGGGGGVSFPIVFPSGTASPQLDATGLGAAINFNGSSTSNGNIVLNPGNVAGNASVVVNAARGDQPALYLKSASGTTTAPVFSLRDSSNVARVYVMQSGDASCPNCLNTEMIQPTADNSFDSGTSSLQWRSLYLATALKMGGTTVIDASRNASFVNLTVSGTCTGCGGGGGGAVTSVSGSGSGISVSPTTGAVVVSNTGVTSLSGTSNQIIVSASTGSITLSTPQSIGTGSSVAFHAINLDATVGSAYQMGGNTVIDSLRQGTFTAITSTSYVQATGSGTAFTAAGGLFLVNGSTGSLTVGTVTSSNSFVSQATGSTNTFGNSNGNFFVTGAGDMTLASVNITAGNYSVSGTPGKTYFVSIPGVVIAGFPGCTGGLIFLSGIVVNCF
jgi:hypothetical protein